MAGSAGKHSENAALCHAVALPDPGSTRGGGRWAARRPAAAGASAPPASLAEHGRLGRPSRRRRLGRDASRACAGGATGLRVAPPQGCAGRRRPDPLGAGRLPHRGRGRRARRAAASSVSSSEGMPCSPRARRRTQQRRSRRRSACGAGPSRATARPTPQSHVSRSCGSRPSRTAWRHLSRWATTASSSPSSRSSSRRSRSVSGCGAS